MSKYDVRVKCSNCNRESTESFERGTPVDLKGRKCWNCGCPLAPVGLGDEPEVLTQESK